MAENLEDAELIDLTTKNKHIAIARCTEGLGCVVYAEGIELPPWASRKIEELVDLPLRDGALISNATQTSYFVCQWNSESGELAGPQGPMELSELRGN